MRGASSQCVRVVTAAKVHMTSVDQSELVIQLVRIVMFFTINGQCYLQQIMTAAIVEVRYNVGDHCGFAD